MVRGAGDAGSDALVAAAVVAHHPPGEGGPVRGIIGAVRRPVRGMHLFVGQGQVPVGGEIAAAPEFVAELQVEFPLRGQGRVAGVRLGSAVGGRPVAAVGEELRHPGDVVVIGKERHADPEILARGVGQEDGMLEGSAVAVIRRVPAGAHPLLPLVCPGLVVDPGVPAIPPLVLHEPQQSEGGQPCQERPVEQLGFGVPRAHEPHVTDAGSGTAVIGRMPSGAGERHPEVTAIRAGGAHDDVCRGPVQGGVIGRVGQRDIAAVGEFDPCRLAGKGELIGAGMGCR